MKKTFTFWKSLFLLFALIVGSTSVWATDKTMTFVQSSTSAGTLSGDVPDGVTATFANTYTNNKEQLTNGNSMTLTISGWASTTTIKGVTLEVKNNKSSGNGSATVTIGTTTLGTLSITGLGDTYQEKEVKITETYATSDLVIYIECPSGKSNNSVYCDKFIITYEEAAPSGPSISVNPSSVNATAAAGNGTIDVTYNNLTNYSADVIFYKADGETAADYDHSWITKAEINASTKDLDYSISANTTGATRTAYLKVSATGDEGTVESPLITITQAKPVVNTTYTLVTSVVPGRHYIVASGKSGEVYAMGYDKGNNRDAVSVNAEQGQSTSTITVADDAGVYEFLIEVEEETGYFTILDEDNDKGGYLYAGGSGSGKNYLKTSSNLDSKGNGLWSIGITSAGIATIIAQGDNTNNNMRFNNGNTKLFSCYSSGQQDIYLFERDGDTGTQNFTVSINSACNDGKDNYYGTFSAPFAFTVPSDVTVSEIGINNGKLNVQNYATGVVVPANTGVMISSDSYGEHSLTIVATTGTSVLGSDNCLRATGTGIEADDMSAADANCKFYRLTMHNGTQIGFWWGAANGAAFDLGANKAYLAVPTGVNAREGFTFDNTATGINGVEEIAPVTKTCKVVKNGRLVIETANGEFTIDGARVK